MFMRKLKLVPCVTYAYKMVRVRGKGSAHAGAALAGNGIISKIIIFINAMINFHSRQSQLQL